MDQSSQKPDTSIPSEQNSPTSPSKMVELEDLKTASTSVASRPIEKSPSLSQTRNRSRVIGAAAGVVVTVIVLSVVGFYLSNQPHTAPQTEKTLSDADLQKLSVSSIGYDSSKQSLNFHSPVAFDKGLTVDGVTTIKDLVVIGTFSNSSGPSTNKSSDGNTTLQGQVTAKSLQISGNLIVGGISTFNGNASFNGSAAFAGALQADSISVKSAQLGSLTFGHVITNGATPVGALAAAAGGGSFQVSGNDTSGTVVVTAGGGAHTGDLVTITFKTPYTSTPHVSLTPVGITSAGVSYYVTRSVIYFTIGVLNPVPAQAYTFDYFVSQ